MDRDIQGELYSSIIQLAVARAVEDIRPWNHGLQAEFVPALVAKLPPRSRRRREVDVRANDLTSTDLSGAVSVSMVYARLYRERTGRPRRGLSPKTKSPLIGHYARIHRLAVARGLVAEELVVAAFDVLRNWHGLNYPPLSALTPERLLKVYHVWRTKMATDAIPQAHGRCGEGCDHQHVADYYQRLWKVRSTQRTFQDSRARGVTLEAFARDHAAFMSPDWAVRQLWWPALREGILSAPGQTVDRRAEFFEAERMPRHLEMAVMTAISDEIKKAALTARGVGAPDRVWTN